MLENILEHEYDVERLKRRQNCLSHLITSAVA